VRLTLLYISSEAVIPAKAGIQIENTGFRVKPGMTIKVKGLLTQYTRTFNFNIWLLDFELLYMDTPASSIAVIYSSFNRSFGIPWSMKSQGKTSSKSLFR
jgi:hypothetical protein